MTKIRQYCFDADEPEVIAIELRNSQGAMVRLLTFGATIQSLCVPDRRGTCADIVLGHATLAEYRAQRQYFGATVGRFANRIAGGVFTLDGRRYMLDINNGSNHLHGGKNGFDRANWRIESLSETPYAGAVLTHTSPDGEGGYPGNLQITATFSLNDANELTIEYLATTDRATIVNITNHSYFNLGGEGSGTALEHKLLLHADYFTPVDDGLVPTGELRTVCESPFDFREPRIIESRIRSADPQLRIARGYDHNFAVSGAVNGAGALRTMATLFDEKSGRRLDLASTAPGMQFYSSNFLDATSIGKRGNPYRQGDGLCLEPQNFPNAPNIPSFPSPRLESGATYRNAMVFRFGVA